MQEDYSDPESIRKVYESSVRRTRLRHGLFTGALILLAAGLAGFSWYAYSTLGRHDLILSQIPLTLSDVQRDMFNLGQQAKATDAKVEDWTSRQEALRGHLNQARSELMARIDSTRKQATEASNALVQRLQTEVATQIDNIKARLAHLEGAREGDLAQIEGLQQELAQVRSQVNQQGQELSSVQSRVDRTAISSEREPASAKTTQKRDRRDSEITAGRFAVKRVDFEVFENQSSQIAPGISLQVDSTDVSYQRLNGSVLAPDGRTTWLRQLNVQEPVFLTRFEDGRTRELVITRVNTNGAVGYVLVPAQENARNRGTRPFTSPEPGE